MRFVRLLVDGQIALAVEAPDGIYHGRLAHDADYPGDLPALVAGGLPALSAAHAALLAGPAFKPAELRFLPPLPSPPKILCVGLNYAAHSAESGFTPPDYPTIFSRFACGFVGHGSALIRPRASTQFDYEGELVAVIGKPGRHIKEANALDHVIGYSIFNDGSIRDFQLRTPQWTVGKNFDGTGGFGPCFVTADALPPGGAGLHLQTRLNGNVVQDTSTSDMIFNVVQLVTLLSAAFTLETGDIIVTGTPSGVGMARKPPLYMKAGDVCEIEIEGIGILRNPVEDETM